MISWQSIPLFTAGHEGFCSVAVQSCGLPEVPLSFLGIQLLNAEIVSLYFLLSYVPFAWENENLAFNKNVLFDVYLMLQIFFNNMFIHDILGNYFPFL